MKNNNKKIWDYFDDQIEYPRNVADNPIPYGVVWQYISSTFLNGIINYVNPISCYVINRYTREDSSLTDCKVSVRNKEGFGGWYNFEGTKKELLDAIIDGEKIEMYHTDLSCFNDDLIIIARINDECDGKYIFFWFDMDVSDCCIGKFETEDSEEEIIKSVENWLTEDFVKDKNHEELHDEDSSGYHKLPLSFIRGWIQF